MRPVLGGAREVVLDQLPAVGGDVVGVQGALQQAGIEAVGAHVVEERVVAVGAVS
jgi:hypothetical protein